MYASTISSKKLQNVIRFSSGIIQHCLEFTPWFPYKSIHFYNTHVCITKLSQLLFDVMLSAFIHALFVVRHFLLQNVHACCHGTRFQGCGFTQLSINLDLSSLACPPVFLVMMAHNSQLQVASCLGYTVMTPSTYHCHITTVRSSYLILSRL